MPFLLGIHYGCDLFGQKYAISAVDLSSQEISAIYFQIRRSRSNLNFWKNVSMQSHGCHNKKDDFDKFREHFCFLPKTSPGNVREFFSDVLPMQ